MLIIVDKKIPPAAKINLRKFGNLMELETSGITYPAISGHPDIFFTQIDDKLIIAPNLPDVFLKQLDDFEIGIFIGEKPVGAVYPETARFNASISSRFFVHHHHISDNEITRHCNHKIFIEVRQGYTRCNLIFLSETAAITSDSGISRKLPSWGVEVLLVNPRGIILPGFEHGFFGGCCGVMDNQLFILGNISLFSEGKAVQQFAEKHDLRIVQLCNTPLFDGGGIIFASSIANQ